MRYQLQGKRYNQWIIVEETYLGPIDDLMQYYLDSRAETLNLQLKLVKITEEVICKAKPPK